MNERQQDAPYMTATDVFLVISLRGAGCGSLESADQETAILGIHAEAQGLGAEVESKTPVS